MVFDGHFRLRETEGEEVAGDCGLLTLQAGETVTAFGTRAER